MTFIPVASPLEYDFTGLPGAQGQVWAVRGVVPEPTERVRSEFFAALRGSLPESLRDLALEELTLAAMSISQEAQEEAARKALAAWAILCQGSPTIEVLEAQDGPLAATNGSVGTSTTAPSSTLSADGSGSL